MTQSKTLGEVIRTAMKKKGITQNQLAKKMCVDRTTLSKYMNGHLNTPYDIKRKLVVYLKDPILRIKVHGTTSSNVVYDKLNFELYLLAVKAIEEFQKATKSIEEVLHFAYNIESKSQMSNNQKNIFEQMLDDIEDANHACDMMDVAATDLGADLEERNKRCYERYLKNGYISRELNHEKIKM